jgi:hypothetical protein
VPGKPDQDPDKNGRHFHLSGLNQHKTGKHFSPKNPLVRTVSGLCSRELLRLLATERIALIRPPFVWSWTGNIAHDPITSRPNTMRLTFADRMHNFFLQAVAGSVWVDLIREPAGSA